MIQDSRTRGQLVSFPDPQYTQKGLGTRLAVSVVGDSVNICKGDD